MCFEPGSLPPRPPRSGSLATSERRTLLAEDGTGVAARVARTGVDDAPGVVVVPDIRGLMPYYEQLADLFAEAGVNAVAIDTFSRAAGTGYRDKDFDFEQHRASLDDGNMWQDVGAALDALREVTSGPLHVLGFCAGGRTALLNAARPGIAGVVGFYPWPARVQAGGTGPQVEAEAGRLTAPVLSLFGGGDERIPPAEYEAFTAALAAAGTPHSTVVFEDAPHSFFDRTMAEHAAHCERAWDLVLRLFDGEPVADLV